MVTVDSNVSCVGECSGRMWLGWTLDGLSILPPGTCRTATKGQEAWRQTTFCFARGRVIVWVSGPAKANARVCERRKGFECGQVILGGQRVAEVCDGGTQRASCATWGGVRVDLWVLWSKVSQVRKSVSVCQHQLRQLQQQQRSLVKFTEVGGVEAMMAATATAMTRTADNDADGDDEGDGGSRVAVM